MPNRNAERASFGGVKRVALILCQAKEGHNWLELSRLCSASQDCEAGRGLNSFRVENRAVGKDGG